MWLVIERSSGYRVMRGTYDECTEFINGSKDYYIEQE